MYPPPLGSGGRVDGRKRKKSRRRHVRDMSRSPPALNFTLEGCDKSSLAERGREETPQRVGLKTLGRWEYGGTGEGHDVLVLYVLVEVGGWREMQVCPGRMG